jgi:hypothetical protein
MNRLCREDANTAYAHSMTGPQIINGQVSILASKKILRISEECE